MKPVKLRELMHHASYELHRLTKMSYIPGEYYTTMMVAGDIPMHHVAVCSRVEAGTSSCATSSVSYTICSAQGFQHMMLIPVCRPACLSSTNDPLLAMGEPEGLFTDLQRHNYYVFIILHIIHSKSIYIMTLYTLVHYSHA